MPSLLGERPASLMLLGIFLLLFLDRRRAIGRGPPSPLPGGLLLLLLPPGGRRWRPIFVAGGAACPRRTALPAGLVSLPAGARGLRGQMLAQLCRGPILTWNHGAALGFGPWQRLAGCNASDNDALRTRGGHRFKGSSPELLKKLLLALLNARHRQAKGHSRGAVRSAETMIPNRGTPGSGLCPRETYRDRVGKIGVQGGGWGASAGQAGEKGGLSPAFSASGLAGAAR